MRRIYKTEILSSYYSNWISQEEFRERHREYDAGNVHYFDLRMSLFYCQKGLCAYTEQKLCKPNLIQKDKWKNGKYIGLKDNTITDGHIEHFDESLKVKKGWLWDNLFMVHGDTNVRKGSDSVNYILKPDSPEYDPYKYLQFDYEVDTFYPRIDLTDEEIKKVEYMIRTLGLNHVHRREDMIQDLKIDFKSGIELEEPKEYITAWNMTLALLKMEA